jgi:hypothetical protein
MRFSVGLATDLAGHLGGGGCVYCAFSPVVPQWSPRIGQEIRSEASLSIRSFGAAEPES